MNYVFDTPELEKKAKRRINLWAVPLWLTEHWVLGSFLVSILLGAVFFGLHFLWTPFLVLTFISWVIAFCIGFSGTLWAILEFAHGNGIQNLQSRARQRYEHSQRIED